MFAVCGRSYIGTSRSVNQDAYCILAAQTPFGEAALIAVCDGVGGLSHGEVASSFVVRELSRWFEEAFPSYAASNAHDGVVDLANLVGAWSIFLEDANSRLLRYGQGIDACLGTTMTVLMVFGARFALAHVGDCRAYRLRDGSFEQLTRDQTLVQREVESGRMSPEAALTHPRGSVILQAVGAQEAVEPAFSFGDVEEGDVFLVACDGFYRRLDVEGLAGKLGCGDAASEDFLDSVLSDAVDEVVDAGEKDNITAILLHVDALDAATSALLPGDDATERLADFSSGENTVAEDDSTRGFEAGA